MKKIQRVKDLPNWFDLTNYDGLVGFGPQEWSSAILARDGFAWLVDSHQVEEEALLSMLSEPLIVRGSWRHPGLVENRENLKFGSIESLTVLSAGFLRDEWEEHLPEEHRQAYAASDCRQESLEQGAMLERPFELSTGRDPVDTAQTPTVQVDLAATDDVILRDFKRWLDAARTAFKFDAPPKSVSSDSMRDWIDLKVLPYFDLMLWSRYAKTEIPLHVLGEALFPGDPDGNLAERVRRTVRKRAKEVVNFNMATVLGMQAARK